MVSYVAMVDADMGNGETISEIAVTSVRIERSKLDALRVIAIDERRSVSQQIRWLIDRCIEEGGREAA